MEGKKKERKRKSEKAEKAEAEEKTAGALKKEGINPRGRIFEGRVIRRFPRRITIEFEKMRYIRKYERYLKTKTKIHARLPIEMQNLVDAGDLVKIQECRPLSKLIHFVVIEKIKRDKERKVKEENKK